MGEIPQTLISKSTFGGDLTTISVSRDPVGYWSTAGGNVTQTTAGMTYIRSTLRTNEDMAGSALSLRSSMRRTAELHDRAHRPRPWGEAQSEDEFLTYTLSLCSSTKALSTTTYGVKFTLHLSAVSRVAWDCSANPEVMS